MIMLEIRGEDSGLLGHMPIGGEPQPGRFKITAIKPNALAKIGEDDSPENVVHLSDDFESMEFHVVQRYFNRVETGERLTWGCILVHTATELKWLIDHGAEWLTPPVYAKATPIERGPTKDQPRGSHKA